MTFDLTRRGLVAGAAALLPTAAFGQAKAQLAPLTSILTGRTYGPDAPPVSYPDPDILILSPEGNKVFIGHSNIRRVGTGMIWAEGPAWSNQGQYVVWSDVTADVQYRYIWETGEITPFRRPPTIPTATPSTSRAARFRRNISCAGWCGSNMTERSPSSPTATTASRSTRPTTSPCTRTAASGSPIPIMAASCPKAIPTKDQARSPMASPTAISATACWGLSAPRSRCVRRRFTVSILRGASIWCLEGKPDLVANGIAFSPDYSKVYLCWGRNLAVAEVEGGKIANLRTFTDCMVDGIKCGPDGHRVDAYGNVWSGSTAPLGYCGVTVWNPQGKLIGRIRLPEVCANVCFCGPKRDHLFMAGSQSAYLLHVGVKGRPSAKRGHARSAGPRAGHCAGPSYRIVRLRNCAGDLRWGQRFHPKVPHAQIARYVRFRHQKPRSPDQDLQGVQAQGGACGAAQGPGRQRPLETKARHPWRAFSFADALGSASPASAPDRRKSARTFRPAGCGWRRRRGRRRCSRRTERRGPAPSSAPPSCARAPA